MQSRASLLALAASLEATAAELSAKAAGIRASLEGAEPAQSDVITLEAATRLLGSKRRAREFIARCEREGFAVSRVGHAVFMARAEWDRAVEATSPKRAKPSANDNAESPAALFASAGCSPSTPKRPRAA